VKKTARRSHYGEEEGGEKGKDEGVERAGRLRGRENKVEVR